MQTPNLPRAWNRTTGSLGLLLLAVEPVAHFWPVPLGAALADGFSNLALALFSWCRSHPSWSRDDLPPTVRMTGP